ncbi:Crp/Fnr family transcriptional regulator [Halomonas sp. MCCC 1A17488]|uniref:Crp/Fnr family transcriptional regulator n=1 Tax=unclassified Halomonas TaxID=2609666 RepID=UPI0018D26537|nr:MULTISPECIES: Crp/Fnr family transcriptional regulator [unclassified Halomonas]MCE8016264.1 Crp/Fnr family transcriptional regulator [Halomonas sp. MCCC 1A17488]MCG3239597.1 Crp/Fnr family transcriptional regulator [Halomonas sp. MCCC 1A17488]QPP50487.1 Crp/Fnr family transcriptional regulator [Halomonas sp. SS10-MC5]
MDVSPSYLSLLLIRKWESVFSLSEEETQAIRDLPVHTMVFESNQDIVRIGDCPLHSFLVLKGFASSYKLTTVGDRQIMALHIPGDIPDLQNLYLKRIDCSIVSITPCTIGFFQLEDLRHICKRFPRISAAFWRETLVDASILREWVVNIGRRDAYTRIAHLLCEFLVRLQAVGLVENGTFHFPITQANLADATGISAVHMSRALKALRENGLIQTSRMHLAVPDLERLKEAGEFDPHYLHLEENAAAGFFSAAGSMATTVIDDCRANAFRG